MNAFTIDLATLPTGRSTVVLEAPAVDLGLDAEAWTGPVAGRFEVEKSGDRVAVQGSVRALARLECGRCLQEFEAEFEAPVTVYAERTGAARRFEEQELERDDYMKFHDGRLLDMREEARESLLLELPMIPRCRDDCRGLCPTCGGDRNLGLCVCESAREAARGGTGN